MQTYDGDEHNGATQTADANVEYFAQARRGEADGSGYAAYAYPQHHGYEESNHMYGPSSVELDSGSPASDAHDGATSVATSYVTENQEEGSVRHVHHRHGGVVYDGEGGEGGNAETEPARLHHHAVRAHAQHEDEHASLRDVGVDGHDYPVVGSSASTHTHNHMHNGTESFTSDEQEQLYHLQHQPAFRATYQESSHLAPSAALALGLPAGHEHSTHEHPAYPPPLSDEPSPSPSRLRKRDDLSDTDGMDDYVLGSADSPDGGRRKKKRLCRYRGCKKLDKGRGFCKSHGGGKRCIHGGCSKSARGSSGLCINHGGGPRCIIANCLKSARTVGGCCKAHGGGMKCIVGSCKKTRRGVGPFCSDHVGHEGEHSSSSSQSPPDAGAAPDEELLQHHHHHHVPQPPQQYVSEATPSPRDQDESVESAYGHHYDEDAHAPHPHHQHHYHQQHHQQHHHYTSADDGSEEPDPLAVVAAAAAQHTAAAAADDHYQHHQSHAAYVDQHTTPQHEEHHAQYPQRYYHHHHPHHQQPAGHHHHVDSSLGSEYQHVPYGNSHYHGVPDDYGHHHWQPEYVPSAQDLKTARQQAVLAAAAHHTMGGAENLQDIMEVIYGTGGTVEGHDDNPAAAHHYYHHMHSYHTADGHDHHDYREDYGHHQLAYE